MWFNSGIVASSGAFTPIVATGGIVADANGYRHHLFTSSGTLTIQSAPSNSQIRITQALAGGSGLFYINTRNYNRLQFFQRGGLGQVFSNPYVTSAITTPTNIAVTIAAGKAGSSNNDFPIPNSFSPNPFTQVVGQSYGDYSIAAVRGLGEIVGNYMQYPYIGQSSFQQIYSGIYEPVNLGTVNPVLNNLNSVNSNFPVRTGGGGGLGNINLRIWYATQYQGSTNFFSSISPDIGGGTGGFASGNSSSGSGSSGGNGAANTGSGGGAAAYSTTWDYGYGYGPRFNESGIGGVPYTSPNGSGSSGWYIFSYKL
jgi:hypothetical protein